MGTFAVDRQSQFDRKFVESSPLSSGVLPVRLTEVVSHRKVGDDKVFRLIYRKF
jgi:hypothetical protein